MLQGNKQKVTIKKDDGHENEREDIHMYKS